MLNGHEHGYEGIPVGVGFGGGAGAGLGAPAGAASFTGLGDLAGGDFYSSAYGVSADGSVVVGTGTSATGIEAFIWDGVNGMRNLQTVLVDDYGLGAALAGWTLIGAQGISADGSSIVGWGLNRAGQTEVWLVDLLAPTPAAVPLPATVAPMIAGLTGLAGLGWRKRRRA